MNGSILHPHCLSPDGHCDLTLGPDGGGTEQACLGGDKSSASLQVGAEGEAWGPQMRHWSPSTFTLDGGLDELPESL